MKPAVLFVVCLSILVVPPSIAAQDTAGRLSIGASAAYADIAGVGKQVHMAFDGDAYYGASLAYHIGRYTSLEFSVGYLQLDVEASMNDAVLDCGQLEQFPILLTARYHLPMLDGRLSPFLGFGGGYYVNDFDASRVVSLAGGKIDTDDSLAFHLSTGLEYRMSDNVTLSLDAKYMWNEADGTYNMIGSGNEDLDLNTLLIGAGVKVFVK